MSGSSLATPMTDEDRMEASDGTVITIGPDGEVYFEAKSPAVHRPQDDKKFEQNLAETLPESILSQIANDYLDGVNADILSRQEFIQNYNNGIDLLPLKLDQASSARGNRQTISKIKNPALLKACMRSQSSARGQLLPAAGPAKIQTISGESGKSDDLALRLGQDLNYYLTEVDRGFYPDTDRMLFYRAYGGSTYKKVYRDPIFRRPISRFLGPDGLIVSEDASDLESALRKTEEHLYSPVEVARMQKLGGWLDIDLGQPMQNLSPARRKILESQGLSSATTRSQDIAYTIYEGYWSFSPEDYGWDDRKTEPGLPAPYRIAMDKDSRKVLGLWRNWRKGDELFRERSVFVKYGLVPGLGFLDYGFLHLIGNQTRVLTAIWQIMVDKGMLANFPGGFKVKGVRTETNEINPGLGEFVQVDLGSLKSIKDAIMGMPYGDVGPALLQLAEMLQKDIEATAGTLDIPTGQGTANTPVGTILAMIEQQAQDLTAVQQRDHRAQKEELRLIRDLFAEYPEDLIHLKRSGAAWDWTEKLEEFRTLDLVPASDPNIPSQAHRILINQFLMTMAEKAPQLFGSRVRNLAKRIMFGVGVNDADDLLAPQAEILQAMKQMQQGAGGKGGGAGQATIAKAQMELPLKQAELEVEKQRLALEQQENQREAANQAQEGQLRAERQQAELAAAERELDQEDRRIQNEETETGASLADPQAQADLEKTRAGAFSAVATGVNQLAQARENVRTGDQQAQAIEDGGTPSGVTPKQPPQQASASLSGNANTRKPNAGKKASKAKGAKA